MSYFTHTKRFVPGDIARAEDVNEVFDDVATGFQNVDNDKVNKAGDTMTGNLTVPEPTAASHAATKNYVDNAASSVPGKVDRSGDTMTGPLNLAGDPTSLLEAAPKQYVDLYVLSGAYLTDATYTYDASNNVTDVVLGDVNGLYWKVVYSYDASNNVIKSQYYKSSDGVTWTGVGRHDYAYNASGYVTTVTWYNTV